MSLQSSPQVQKIFRLLIAPLLLYLAAFFVMTFPLSLQFSSHYFTDQTDGYQMVWDLWWVRHAIIDLHQSPFHTNLLHYPGGASLWLHSLMPFNGLLTIPLRLFLSDIQTFNLLVVVAFAGSGLTAFWLCLAAVRGNRRSFWPSFAGGFGFAFCSYRWAHYFGHLPLISTEWMPLFLLGLLCLLRRPRVILAMGTAAALLIMLLIDQYQFLDCVLASVVVFAWWFFCDGGIRRLRGQRYLIPMIVFLAGVAVSCGPVVLIMWQHTRSGPLSRSHDADQYSADMLGPWVPDFMWMYHEWTRPIWEPLQYSYEEKSVCIGPLIVAAAVWGLSRGRRCRQQFRFGSKSFFAALGILFMLLSFGPKWRFWTVEVNSWTPYRLLAVVFPPIAAAGCTARMMIMAQLAVCVLATAGLARLRDVRRTTLRRGLILLFTAGIVIESQPRTLMSWSPQIPRWVEAVRDDSQQGAVINTINCGDSIDLYYQTIHHRPIAHGNLSRIPEGTRVATEAVLNELRERHFASLAKMGFVFLVTGNSRGSLPLPLVYSDRGVRVYRLSGPTLQPRS